MSSLPIPGGRVPLIPNLGTRWRPMSSSCPRCFTHMRITLVTIYMDAGGPESLCGCYGRIISYPFTGYTPQIGQPTAYSLELLRVVHHPDYISLPNNLDHVSPHAPFTHITPFTPYGFQLPIFYAHRYYVLLLNREF
jgi:hypothetical protein